MKQKLQNMLLIKSKNFNLSQNSIAKLSSVHKLTTEKDINFNLIQAYVSSNNNNSFANF